MKANTVILGQKITEYLSMKLNWLVNAVNVVMKTITNISTQKPQKSNAASQVYWSSTKNGNL